MHRTTIMLPHDLKVQAVRFSEQKGVSLGQLIRECLQQAVQQAEKESGTQDCFFEDKGVYQGEAPDDLCSEHDAYLYGPRDVIHLTGILTLRVSDECPQQPRHIPNKV